MEALSTITAAICLGMIAYQDFSTRSVHWIFFPLLAMAGMGHTFAGIHSLSQLTFFAGCNLGFLGLQGILLTAYFLIRDRSLNGIVNRKIGLGDIFFLVATCFFFSPANFILFYIYSLLLVLSVVGIRLAWRKSPGWSIPLAGFQSAILLISYGIAFLLRYSLLSDHLLLAKIKGQ